jgi:hypothetical protein
VDCFSQSDLTRVVAQSCCYKHREIVQTTDLVSDPLDATADADHIDQQLEKDALPAQSTFGVEHKGVQLVRAIE